MANYAILCGLAACLILKIQCTIVTTPLGPVKGAKKETETGRLFYTFEGIPFAEPPIGELRFEHPVPKKTWSETLDAVGNHVECIQAQSFLGKITGQEDCLVLTVSTPHLPQTGNGQTHLKPVYVYIHGGAFATGTGSSSWYGADLFMDYEIVVVTINYRLGPLGFLTTGNDIIPPNLGLWDQIEALKWVQKNIHVFGGDPTKVTIGGESSGGVSVMALYTTPETKGLFHGAIAQSGTALSGYYHQEKHPLFYLKELAVNLGCNPETSHEEIKKCLQKVDDRTFVEPFLFHGEPGSNGQLGYMPFTNIITLDGSTSRPLIPVNPYEALLDPVKHRVNDVPLMIGANKDEGSLNIPHLIKGGQGMVKQVLENWDELGPLFCLNIKNDEITEEHTEVVAKLTRKYFGQEQPSEENFLPTLQEIIGDEIFAMPAMVTTRTLSRGLKSPVYEYLYAHSGSLKLYDLMTLHNYQIALKLIARLFGSDMYTDNDQVSHFDEIFLMFKSSFLPFEGRYTLEDKVVSKRLLTMWTNFIKTGNPNTPNGAIDVVGGGEWTPITEQSQKWLRIMANESKMELEPHIWDKFQFWQEEIYQTYPPLLNNPKSKSWTDPDTIQVQSSKHNESKIKTEF